MTRDGRQRGARDGRTRDARDAVDDARASSRRAVVSRL